MKIQWSVFFSFLLLLTLVSCGSEEFGAAPKSTSTNANPLTSFSHSSCSNYTLIKPKVDILYVIDNSSSSYYIASDVKTAISNTVNRLSTDFDYRVIGTPLLESASGNNDYQVMTNSSDLQGIPADSRRVTSAGEFTFFSNSPIPGTPERGLSRVVSFVDTHKNNLIRNNSYLVIVLVSNGLDFDVEEPVFTNGETRLNTVNWNARLASFRSLKTQLNSMQLRMISVTAKRVCQSGWRSSLKSYVKMANQLYVDSGASDSSNLDAYDLCDSSGVSSIFTAINNSIRQVVLPHEYRYWPITFAENNQNVSIQDLQVRKVSSNGSSVILSSGTDWVYEDRGSVQTVNTRELPTPGEPVSGRHFIRFINRVVYPDCVLVTSVSRTEYFGYVVLPQKPQISTVSLRINGRPITQSTSNGWSDLTQAAQTLNIKVANPSDPNSSVNPPVMRTGFMLQLNGPANYYKSGDSVEVYYLPAGI